MTLQDAGQVSPACETGRDFLTGWRKRKEEKEEGNTLALGAKRCKLRVATMVPSIEKSPVDTP